MPPATRRRHEPASDLVLNGFPVRDGIEALADSPILEIFREGVRVPGLIPLWAGESDLPTPGFICEAATRALAEGRTFYSDNRGTPAMRAAIARYHARIFGIDLPDERIAFTYSGMNAVMQVAQATLSAGDNAIVVTPSWPNAARAIEINQAAVREVPLDRDASGWHLDLDRVFEAADARTRLLYLATPANPTGWTIGRAQAQALLDGCRDRRIALLSDEVYHRIVTDRPHALSFLELARPDDPVFVVNSFSKNWAMTGWRMGWLVFPSGCVSAFEKLIQFNTSGGLEFMQAAGIAALDEGEGFVAEMVARCRAGRAIVSDGLATMPRVSAIPSEGAFYAMAEIEGVTDTLQFCRRAVHEARLGIAPGTSFGRGAERLVRLCTAKSPALLDEALGRLSRFVESYREN